MKLKVAILGSAVLAGALIVAPATNAFAPFEIHNKLFLGNSTAGKTTPVTIDFSHKCVPSVPEPCVPPGGTALKVVFPAGAKVNPEAFETCPTDVFRETYGDGCQARSRIGQGIGTLDARELNLGFLPATVDVYKIDRKSGHIMDVGLIAHEPQSGANVPFEFGVKNLGGRVALDIEDFAVPPIFSGRVVLIAGRFQIDGSGKVKEKVKGKKGKGKQRTRTVKKYLVTNSKFCPSSKTWIFKNDQKWEDGSHTSFDLPVRCKGAKK